jgi:hypothetical protein
MVYLFPRASKDIASLVIWGFHLVAASFGSQALALAPVVGVDDKRNLETPSMANSPLMALNGQTNSAVEWSLLGA